MIVEDGGRATDDGLALAIIAESRGQTTTAQDIFRPDFIFMTEFQTP